MKVLKVLVAGGRDFTSKAIMLNYINMLIEEKHIPENVTMELVSGMAKGADLTAVAIFRDNGLVIHEYPADWKDMSEPCIKKQNRYGEYNALAGMKRNTEMANEADILIAFWDGKSKGTLDMIQKMRDLGKQTFVYNY